MRSKITKLPLKTRDILARHLAVALCLVSLLLDVGWDCIARKRVSLVVDAILVGGVLLPHGDFALDPTFFAKETEEYKAAKDVALGARQVGRWLLEHQKQHEDPLIILMTTPHGIKLDYNYGIYISARGSGTALIGGDCINGGESRRGWSSKSSRCQRKPYNVTIESQPLAPTRLGEDLLSALQHRYPVSGIYSSVDDAPIPLNWGEIIPLLLIRASGALPVRIKRKTRKPRIFPLVWTFPHRRYDHAVDMVPELLSIGADIAKWIHQRPERIAVVISGDLSHTHLPEGPYGYSNASAPFDDAIGVWAGNGHILCNTSNNTDRPCHNPCHSTSAAALLERAAGLQPDAKSCGFTGYVLWHGMMCSSSLAQSNEFDALQMYFHSKVFVNRNVTYYGMLGAISEPIY